MYQLVPSVCRLTVVPAPMTRLEPEVVPMIDPLGVVTVMVFEEPDVIFLNTNFLPCPLALTVGSEGAGSVTTKLPDAAFPITVALAAVSVTFAVTWLTSCPEKLSQSV